jgi:hypothetical protein
MKKTPFSKRFWCFPNRYDHSLLQFFYAGSQSNLKAIGYWLQSTFVLLNVSEIVNINQYESWLVC